MSEGSLIAVKTIPQVQLRNISSLFVTTQVPMWTLRLCCNRNQVSKLSPVCSTTALGRESCDCEDLLAHLRMGCNSDRKKVITNVFFSPARTLFCSECCFCPSSSQVLAGLLCERPSEDKFLIVIRTPL